MRKTLLIVFATLLLSILAACSEDELSILEVDFEVPETVNVGETVELKATVTYGDEMVTDADEVVLEVWEKGKRDYGDRINENKHEDRKYTSEDYIDSNRIY